MVPILRSCLTWWLCLGFSLSALADQQAEPPRVLAYEGFDDEPTGTETLDGGQGWKGPWKVESGGIRVASADDVPFSGWPTKRTGVTCEALMSRSKS